MSESTKYSAFKKWGLRLLWAFIGLLVVGLVIRISLKTTFVQKQVRSFIVSTANNQLNGTLSIDRLSGDLWKEVTVSQIQLMQEQDTVAHIDSAHAAYNIWALLQGAMDITELSVYQPRVSARQDSLGWNVMQVLSKTEDTETTESAGMSIQVGDFQLVDGVVSIRSDSLVVGSYYTLKAINVGSSFGYDGTSYNVEVRDLSFRLREESIEQGIDLQASGSAKEQEVTLQKLVVATGTSVLSANGFTNLGDTTLQLGMNISPLDWTDMSAIMAEYPIRKDLDMGLSVRGNTDQIDVLLKMQAEGLESLQFDSRMAWEAEPIIQKISIVGRQMNFAKLLGDTTYPRIDTLNTSFNGEVEISDFTKTQGEFDFSAEGITGSPYNLQSVAANGKVENKQGTLQVEVIEGTQSISGNVTAKDIWSEVPTVEGALAGRNINPSFWLQDTTYQGDVAFDLDFSGLGWYPEKEPWDYSLRMAQGTFLGQSVRSASVKGKLSSSNITADARVNVGESFVAAAVLLENLEERPSYDFQLRTERFDLGMFIEEEDFSTAIDGNISGSGHGFNLADMQLQSTVRVDSSVFNGAKLEEVTADFSIRDSIATVDSAQLKSGVSDGAFSLNLNMLNFYDAENKLALDMNLKNMGPLAPLAGVDMLQATGKVKGTLRPAANQELNFLGTIDLEEIAYNELFTSREAKGSIDIMIGEQLMYVTDLELQEPTFSGMPFQNLNIRTKGSYADSTAKGEVDFELSSATEGRIEQEGSYHVAPDSVYLRTDALNFISDYRMLTLESPFALRYYEDQLEVDTFRISSGDGAFLEMALPIVSAQRQRGFVNARGLNVSVIQSSFLGETYFDGTLSGTFNINRQDTTVQAQTDIILSEVSFRGAAFDSLMLSGDVANERLEGTITLRDRGQQLMDGEVNLPFKLGDPEEFEEAFFNESVSGDLRVRDISIDRFKSLFDQAMETETSGIISFWGTLGGTAGDPEFDADLALKEAMLSGVAVDSVVAGANYRHAEEELSLDATVVSLNQPAAQISARFPLFIDMKTFRVDLPQQQDRISVDIETDDFNLRALNDFIDPLLLRDVRGRMNGEIEVRGAVEDLKAGGDLTLRQGQFRLVPAGITVDNISTALTFEENQIRLSRLSAKSGSGKLQAKGTVDLQRLIPGDIDLSLEAQNFRVANTSEMNAIINLDARAAGTITSPKVSGSLDVQSGFFKLDNFGEKSVESVKLDSEEEQGPSVSVYDSLALDMDVGFNRRFFIQNERYLELEVELAGDLDLVKQSGRDLELFGSITTASGYARPFGKEFDLQEGVVTFSGNPENPQLQIRTRYEPPQTQEEIIIWYVIEGTVENPQFRYESQPPMELENIISYTIFGQPFYALDSWKQVVASSGSNTTAADVALDVLLDRVETLATQQLGIDVVKIDNTRSGGEAGTSITTGWYINPKVFFAIQNVITGSTPETGFMLEYMLRENLKLILRQGNNIRQGVDIKWEYDY